MTNAFITNIGILELIKFSNYKRVLGLGLKMNLVYSMEIKRLTNKAGTSYINKLLDKGIIYQDELSEGEKLELLSREGINEFNILQIKAYRLSTWAKKELFKLRNRLYSCINNEFWEKLKNHRLNYRNKQREQARELDYINKLKGINFKEVLKKSHFIGDLEHLGIKDAYDFNKMSLRELGKVTRITKTTLEIINKNLHIALGGFEEC